LEILSIINDTRNKDQKKEYEQGAFIGWQLTEFFKSVLSKKAKQITFQSYLEQLGLLEKEKTTKEDRQEMIARKTAKAERVKQKDALRRVK